MAHCRLAAPAGSLPGDKTAPVFGELLGNFCNLRSSRLSQKVVTRVATALWPAGTSGNFCDTTCDCFFLMRRHDR